MRLSVAVECTSAVTFGRDDEASETSMDECVMRNPKKEGRISVIQHPTFTRYSFSLIQELNP